MNNKELDRRLSRIKEQVEATLKRYSEVLSSEFEYAKKYKNFDAFKSYIDRLDNEGVIENKIKSANTLYETYSTLKCLYERKGDFGISNIEVVFDDGRGRFLIYANGEELEPQVRHDDVSGEYYHITDYVWKSRSVVFESKNYFEQKAVSLPKILRDVYCYCLFCDSKF